MVGFEATPAFKFFYFLLLYILSLSLFTYFGQFMVREGAGWTAVWGRQGEGTGCAPVQLERRPTHTALPSPSAPLPLQVFITPNQARGCCGCACLGSGSPARGDCCPAAAL